MPADTPKGLPEDEHSALTSDSPPLVKRLKRVAGRRTLKVSRKLTIAPATALSGPVPRGPVFVSAEQMRREQTRKQQLEQEDGRALKVAAPSAPTAELLMQKWLPAQRMSASRS